MVILFCNNTVSDLLSVVYIGFCDSILVYSDFSDTYLIYFGLSPSFPEFQWQIESVLLRDLPVA